jgi:hypothetical protein
MANWMIGAMQGPSPLDNGAGIPTMGRRYWCELRAGDSNVRVDVVVKATDLISLREVLADFDSSLRWLVGLYLADRFGSGELDPTEDRENELNEYQLMRLYVKHVSPRVDLGKAS